MRKIVFSILRKFNLGILLLGIHPKSALLELGWAKSFRLRKVISKDGQPIPWWTYSFIDFITPRLSNSLRVLEFGSGNSTIYLSKKVKEVVAIEDYPDWAEKISKEINKPSTVVSVNLISEYDSYIHKIEGKFDVLIIDNLGNRILAAKNGLRLLNDGGVVIWDNTDGLDWEEIKSLMKNYGFREISFTGMIPQELNLSKTTLFYRDSNCMGI